MVELAVECGNDGHIKAINVTGPDGALIKSGSRDSRGGGSDSYDGGGLYKFLGGNIKVVKVVRVAAGGMEVMVKIALVVVGMVEVVMVTVVVVEVQVGVTKCGEDCHVTNNIKIHIYTNNFLNIFS